MRLCILFGNDWFDDSLEDNSEFFDPSGTCVDDGWVHDIPPREEDFDSYHSWISYTSSDGDPSWWAFVQEYYASDRDPESVNKLTNTNRRPPPNQDHSPTIIGSQKSATTPSSCASIDSDGNGVGP
ncbi:UNVERIFIED_CONTAM: hypothetical protein Sindi_1858900 [Sesamum indicum]